MECNCVVVEVGLSMDIVVWTWLFFVVLMIEDGIMDKLFWSILCIIFVDIDVDNGVVVVDMGRRRSLVGASVDFNGVVDIKARYQSQFRD